MSEHSTSVSLYARIYGILLLLTAVTVGVAYLDLGPLNTAVAILIAGGKSVLVMLYFMHLKGADRTLQIYAAAGFAWLVLFNVLFLADIYTRTLPPM